MLVLKLRQSELAEEPIPLITIRRVLKSAGFDLANRIDRQDDFFNDTVVFFQEGEVRTSQIVQEPCTS